MSFVIFLDIDGVLNTDEYIQKADTDPTEKPRTHIDPERVKHLNNILEVCPKNTQVVLTSTWKKEFNEQEMTKILQDQGFRGTVDDTAISIREPAAGYGSFSTRRELREQTVRHHLKQNPEIECFLIIDDYPTTRAPEDVWLEGQLEYLIYTNGEGLQNQHVKEVEIRNYTEQTPGG